MSLNAFSQQPALKPNLLKPDTIKKPQVITNTLSKKSKSSSGLTSKVTYTAEDSIKYSRDGSVVYLYGKGRITYEDFELDADYIKLDQKNNTAFAKGFTDAKSNRYRGKPILKQGNEPPITTDSLIFNYQTKKGKSYGLFTDVESGYLQAREFKKNQYDEGSFKNGFYSTCNLPEPHTHFGIHITKGIVTENQIVTGPAYLVIEHVPLYPLFIPFGFFPKTNKRSGGLLFPTFGEDPTRGFFMRDLGYYFGLSDYWDLAFRGTLYSKGSYEGGAAARYRKNYKYDGNINFSYAAIRNGIEGTPGYKPSQDFHITWSHYQRPEANPGTTFSASVDAGTGKYYQNTAAGGTYNITELAKNTLSSSISYGKTFGRFNFTSSLRHSQDIERETVSLTLPEFNLSMLNNIYPFNSKKRIGEQKWYQKLNIGYGLNGRNIIDTKENLLFKEESLKNFRNGVQHAVPVNLTFNVFKFFQFNSGLQYNEKWYLQTIRKRIETNELGNKTTITDTISGFARAYEYSVNSGFSTALYGQVNFNKGKLMAIRHVAKPSVSFNYRPDFGSNGFGFYRKIEGDLPESATKYSIFENSLYGSPSTGRVAGIGFSLENNIEAKIRSTRDSTANFVKIPILQNLRFSGSYNFAATQFKLSNIEVSGNTAFFKQKLGVNFNGTFDPYQLDETGIRINEYAINNGQLFRLTNLGLSTSFSLNSTALKMRNNNSNSLGVNQEKMTEQQKDELDMISRDPNAFVDFNIPWNFSASYSFYYSKPGLKSTITNTLNFRGDLSVTPKWKITYDSGYDFIAKKVSSTQFSIYRDLHCWDLSFSWAPFGQYQFYSVDLRVKASILQDLKLSKRRSYYNY
ncbi:MAG: putative LPS assembly protein LptD [Daejeonella sp.]